ncbi:uncharacterized protein LOC102482422 [Tupaia chinensis]|uniref:uncharacterized protein LOC102482422 n=1 Tax=Tupaia chinensis TaxID=246437 RepID=UPI000703D77E|nr:uncharacterized protein LOC102482422 [Tupaia chinensis]
MLTVVVEVEQGRGPGPEGTCNPTFLLEGPKNLRLLQPGTLEREVEGLVCRVLGPGAAQEAERELLACVQSTLGSVGQGYSVALLLRGRETEAPRLVPQLLQMLFEEALRLGCSGHVFSTLSLVQVRLLGDPRDLLSPEVKNLSALEVAPLGLVVEGASEVEVSNARSASAWYLQAAGAEDRDCPLLQVLAGEAVGKEVEGSLPWIVSWLLEGNNYSGLLLRLDPQGSSLSLLQAALSGASGRRMQVKQVRPTLWNAVEEVQTRRAALRTLRLGLLGDTLTDCGLKQLSRALQELQVIKAWSQCPRYQTSKGARAETMGLPKSQVKGKSQKYLRQGRQHCSQSGRAMSLGLHQRYPLGASEEQTDGTWAWQVPDVALQFSLAQARRQRLREQHQIRIREELKHLEQEEEVVAGHQVKGLLAEEAYEEKQRWHREQTVLRLQLEALQAERDAAEQDLVALYDLHVQATRAQTCHMLQVFRAWQGLWEEKAMTTEHHHRSLLAGILQETINLATQNQELQAQNQQLQHGAD